MILPPTLQSYLSNARHAVAGDQDLAKWGALKGLVAKVFQLLIPNPGSNITVRASPDGPIWDVSSPAINLDVGSSGIVKAGTIGGAMPKIGTVRLNASTPPRLSSLLSGTRYVIATVTASLTVTDSVFVRSWSLTSVILSTTGTAPTPDDYLSDSGVFILHLATFIDGVKTYQRNGGDIWFTICDDLSQTATARLTITVP